MLITMCARYVTVINENYQAAHSFEVHHHETTEIYRNRYKRFSQLKQSYY